MTSTPCRRFAVHVTIASSTAVAGLASGKETAQKAAKILLERPELGAALKEMAAEADWEEDKAILATVGVVGAVAVAAYLWWKRSQ
jgi:hypothetical protein